LKFATGGIDVLSLKLKQIPYRFALSLALLPCVAMAADRPNIVFIMSDDHSVRAVSAYDDSLMQTPNIDRIAANGIRFDRAYVGNSICGPSRATMLTGLHSHGNGFYSNEWSGAFDGEQQTLPRLLQSAGYQTAVIGKWHLYSDPIGFDHWEVIHNHFEQGSYYNPVFRSAEGKEETTGYVAELVTDKANAWLERAAANSEPFFLIYNHKSPHRDWLPGPKELREWDEQARVAEPSTLHRSMAGEVRARREARMSIADNMTDGDVKLSMGDNLTDEQERLWQSAFQAGNEQYSASDLSSEEVVSWKYQRYIKTYMGSIKSMDREIGRLLDQLDALDLAENTIVVYTSDQGFFLGENGWFDKRWMDEVSSRVPLLVQWPGVIEAGSNSSAMVQNIDFAPTLLAAAGVKPDTPMHGISLLPLLEQPGDPSERDLYYHFYENPGFHGVARHYGIHTGRYKLIHYYRNDEWELFDLETDPAEQLNLYNSPAHQKLIPELKQRLQQLKIQYDVPEEDPEAPWYHEYLIKLAEKFLA
jgi:arylsulfatase A-like enzyme